MPKRILEKNNKTKNEKIKNKKTKKIYKKELRKNDEETKIKNEIINEKNNEIIKLIKENEEKLEKIRKENEEELEKLRKEIEDLKKINNIAEQPTSSLSTKIIHKKITYRNGYSHEGDLIIDLLFLLFLNLFFILI
jgi:Fe2+ transport system protein B